MLLQIYYYYFALIDIISDDLYDMKVQIKIYWNMKYYASYIFLFILSYLLFSI